MYLYLCSSVSQSHDVDWHVNETLLPTNQRLFSYRVIFIYTVDGTDFDCSKH